MKQGFLIPVYNHGKTVLPIVRELAKTDLPVILVDDGSEEETKQYLAGTAESFPRTVLVSLPKNRGKGGAVSSGIDKAHDLGLTHVLQIDADGQHDISRAVFFLEQSFAHPEAAICSCPEYDDSVPLSRKKGRKIANIWARIVTLSGDIADALCGFRVYPVEPLRGLIHHHHIDQRMGFDVEVLVRLYWEKVPLLFYPVHVIYPQDGISHFHLVRDNIRITWVFVRLFFGMILRFPLLLHYRRLRRRSEHPHEQG
jgi:glycosyltransferase involved in cell wall biosynthesis